MPVKSIETPLGWVTLVEEAGAITALKWDRQEGEDTPLLDEATREALSLKGVWIFLAVIELERAVQIIITSCPKMTSLSTYSWSFME